MKKAPRWACGKHTWACNADKTHTPVLNRCACGPGGGGINAVFFCRERTDSENGSVDFLSSSSSSSSSSSTHAHKPRGAPPLRGTHVCEAQNTCCLPSDRRGAREKRRGVGGVCVCSSQAAERLGVTARGRETWASEENTARLCSTLSCKTGVEQDAAKARWWHELASTQALNEYQKPFFVTCRVFDAFKEARAAASPLVIER